MNFFYFYLHNKLNKSYFASCLMAEKTSLDDKFVNGALRSTPLSGK